LVSKQSPFCSLGACDGGGGSQGLKAPTIHECCIISNKPSSVSRQVSALSWNRFTLLFTTKDSHFGNDQIIRTPELPGVSEPYLKPKEQSSQE